MLLLGAFMMIKIAARCKAAKADTVTAIFSRYLASERTAPGYRSNSQSCR
jgi:hypothetical protein